MLVTDVADVEAFPRRLDPRRSGGRQLLRTDEPAERPPHLAPLAEDERAERGRKRECDERRWLERIFSRAQLHDGSQRRSARTALRIFTWRAFPRGSALHAAIALVMGGCQPPDTRAIAAPMTADSLQITVTTDKPVYRSGEPVRMTLTLANRSGQERTVVRGEPLPPTPKSGQGYSISRPAHNGAGRTGKR